MHTEVDHFLSTTVLASSCAFASIRGFLIDYCSILICAIYVCKSTTVIAERYDIGPSCHRGTVQTFIEQVESGGKTSTLLPTHAFESANPYPFGIDPVSCVLQPGPL